ncbi:MAG: Zn-dependent M16 (insulinase) family peptidase [Cellvibrionaceae bacterium]|jgi:Zn-dependent M16 (insulinase) family peptidase
MNSSLPTSLPENPESSCHPSFELLRSQTLSSLNITVNEYRHLKTGAQHIHIDADNDENVFLVALRTVPEDSSGVAHMLEHTVLCGSERYPVRDPFFMMIRRSLNTFMNAFTSSDWTAFPFASQNRKDFDNLLDVYLDAVFFSRLDPLDFAQEGHRLEFSEADNTESPLVFKGVVFNEMKGAMSSISSQLWQHLNKYLYPTTTYHHNSGGDPQSITDLSYKQLKKFYQTHYHPSNAIFMTFGNIKAADHQAKFEERVLHRFEKLEEKISVPAEKRYFAPIRAEEAYPYQAEAGETLDNKSHIVMGWLLGPSIDLKANLEVHLLSSLLFDNSASPLQHLLETTELGASPSPLCGMDDSQYEMLFVCGINGSDAAHTLKLEKAITGVLEEIVKNGLPQQQIDASLHQLELRQREIGGDGFPYGLQLILNALSPATHRGDVLGFLDLEDALKQLRQNIQSTEYIPHLIKRLLLDNNHRVTLTLRPDAQFHDRQVKSEENILAEIKKRLSDAEKQQIIDQASALERRQQQIDDDSVLPKVTLKDIPKASQYPTGATTQISDSGATDAPLHYYSAGTNGLSYQQLVCNLPKLDIELLQTLPWYTLCLTEVGLGKDDYLAVQQRQSQVVGGIGSYYSLRNFTDDPQQLHAYTTISAKALNGNQLAMNELMRDTFYNARFDESARLKELITQVKTSREQSVTGNGHVLAMQAASANMNPLAKMSHELMGLGAIKNIKALEAELKQGNYAPLKANLEKLHESLLAAPKQWLAVAEKEAMDDYLNTIKQTWQPTLSKTRSDSLFVPEPQIYTPLNQAWVANSQVHFCAKAYPTVAMGHTDAAALSVLGGVLGNGYLHRTIREQGGAYGGGASQDSNSASFRFFSYRDPRMSNTLKDFDDSIAWLFDETISEQSIEESILGIVSSLDKPGSPAGEAKQEFHAQLAGRTCEKRSLYREQVTQVTATDLRRVAETYLKPDRASTVIVTGNHGEKEANKLGLDIVNL